MFEPEGNRISTGQPEQEAGSVLQRFLSQLGMPTRSGSNELNSVDLRTGDLQSRDPADRPKLPRYYGAPPDQFAPHDSTAYAKVSQGDETDRIKFMLQRASNPGQPSESSANDVYSYNASSGIGSSPSRSSFAHTEAADNSYRPDVLAYLAPEPNRRFSGNSPGALPITSAPISQPTRAFLRATEFLNGGSGLETNRSTAPTRVSPTVNDQPQSPEGMQVDESLSHLDTYNLVQPDAIESRNSDDSTSPKTAKTARETAPQAGAEKQAPGSAANVGKPAALNGGQQPDSFPVVNPAETWKNSDKQYSIPQLKGTVGGTGAKNDPTDVKLVQHLLNAAIISQELPGMKTLPEDGKMSSEMLKTIHEYDRTHGLLPFPGATPQQLLVEPGKGTITKMGMSPLVDQRWSIYDDTIRRDVEYYNKHLPETYKDSKFNNLDWRLVKAMLWTEVEGPADPKWWTRPMQIGNPGDRFRGMYTIMNGSEGTDKYVPQALRAGLRTSELGKMNVRAAIPYLINRAIQHQQVLPAGSDKGRPEVFTKEDGNLINFAKRVGTTVPQLYQDNPGLKDKANSLRPGTPLKVRGAKEVLAWREWEDAAKLYNNKTADYKDRVLRNYQMIKQIWPR